MMVIGITGNPDGTFNLHNTPIEFPADIGNDLEAEVALDRLREILVAHRNYLRDPRVETS